MRVIVQSLPTEEVPSPGLWHPFLIDSMPPEYLGILQIGVPKRNNTVETTREFTAGPLPIEGAYGSYFLAHWDV